MDNKTLLIGFIAFLSGIMPLGGVICPSQITHGCHKKKGQVPFNSYKKR